MKIIGVVPWFDERSSWLNACVASLSRCCEHVVAVDGRFAFFPDSRVASSVDEHEAVLNAAVGANVGLTLHRPREPFFGNEVEKRTLALRLAALVADEYADWILCLDADEMLTKVPSDLMHMLATTEADAAHFRLWMREDRDLWEEREWAGRKFHYPPAYRTPVARLLRALPGLRVEGFHARYVAEKDGETVVLTGPDADPERIVDIPGIEAEHRHEYRSLTRTQAAHEYAVRREQYAFEDF